MAPLKGCVPFGGVFGEIHFILLYLFKKGLSNFIGDFSIISMVDFHSKIH